MSLIVANDLSKEYAGELIFSDVSIDVPPKARIALVGPNGAGKTTLVHLLINEETPNTGTIHTSKNARVAYLPQRPELLGDHTLWEEQLTAFTELRVMEVELHELAEAMSDPDTHETAVIAYGKLQEEFEHLGGYTYETRIKMVLSGVGFGEDDYETPLSRLSGGQKTRALLARLLLSAPDLLILDEPTNHLDINAVEWLENYLRSFEGGVLAISHDRYFIDNFANMVWEMDFGTMATYRGNYSQYVRQREERRENLQKAFDAQQEFIAREMAYIRKHMGSRWTAQAKGRLKKLNTMQKRGRIIDHAPLERKTMRLNIDSETRSGDKVLMTHDLTVGYDVPLFRVPDLTVYRGDVVAIIGANGAGKSTLLKTVIGQLEPLAGNAELGAQVHIGYFAQAHENLKPDHTLLEAIDEIHPMKISEARAYLAPYLFTGDDVFRKVATLSGGERGRLALARLALQGANLLLLDEPTNHLDIESQEILQTVLEEFAGTIVIVSHDRYLIDALATQIWAVGLDQNDHTATRHQLEIFEGTYADYLAMRNQRALDAETRKVSKDNGTGKDNRRQPAQYAEKKHGLNPYELKKRIEALEEHIHTLETRLDEISQALESASAEGNTERVATLGEQYSATQAELESTFAEWEQLAE
jgi:ATP-binding cassette subfamily F protein 3